MELASAVGFIAGIFTSLAALPQFIKSFKTKSTKDVSLGWCIILSIGVLLWIVYGIMINDMPLIISNIVTLIIVLGVFFLKIKYG